MRPGDLEFTEDMILRTDVFYCDPIKNPVTEVLEAWEDGRVVGEFIPTSD